MFTGKTLADVKFLQDKGTNIYMALNSNAVEHKTIKNECEDLLESNSIGIFAFFGASKKVLAKRSLWG